MSHKNLPVVRKPKAVVAKPAKRSKRSTKEEPPKPQRANPAAKATFDNCIGDLHKIKATLIPIQYAALYDVEFDVSDALVTVLDQIDRLLSKLDLLETVI